MKKINLFIAMSLDGYIADEKGGVDWLGGQNNDQDFGNDDMDSYSDFISDIDTVIMGWNTYHQIVTELSPNKWIYDHLTTYVITHHKIASSKNKIFTIENPVELLRKLRLEKGKGIWICGGANLVQQLIKEDVIDVYYITVIPALLGAGIRLFENIGREIKLRLVKVHSYNGMTDLIYVKSNRDIF